MRQKENCPPPPPPDDPCNDCTDKDNPTQQSINIIRSQWCKALYDAKGNLTQQETKFNGENDVFKEKKCMFLHTEENYRRYRNLEICAGTELLKTNELLKANVAKLKDWNKTLGTTLATLVKQVKDIKTKFADLKYAACRLKDSYDDKCNAAQKKALTGITSEKCDDPQKPVIEPCKDAGDNIDDLICLPGGLKSDIDSILQSAADVAGIQIFSNVDSLEPLQKDLSDKSVLFEKHVSTVMKTRKGELDKLQDDLVTSVQSITIAAMGRNNARGEFEGYYDAVDTLCCPCCDCVTEPSNENQQNDCYDCPPRLKNCEEEICDICKEVKITFCCNETPPASNQTAS